MNEKSKLNTKNFLSKFMGLMAAGFVWESGRVLFMAIGWADRTPRFESHVLLVALWGLMVGVYVVVQSLRRMHAVEDSRDQKLAELHEKAERAREGLKGS